MSKDDRKREADRVRRQARKLARQLGCEIEIERRPPFEFGGEFSMLYWVWPPGGVYWLDSGETIREDPLGGDHTAGDWNEVMRHLRVYQRDMHLANIGIEYDVAYTLIELDRSDLILQSARTRDLFPLLLLCDQIEESGRYQPMADTLREAVRRAG